MIYLDWAATAKPRKKENLDALTESFKYYGNPSSLHTEGLLAKNKLEECRTECANILNTNSENIFYTSGGTESNNIALLSFLKKHSVGELISTSIEHPSISEPIDMLKKFGWKVKNINPTESGSISLKKLEKSITDKTKIFSMIYVHNETGVIQPIEEIIKIVRSKEIELGIKIHIHLDGVQSIGKVQIDLKEIDIDSFSISGHKFGAPRGIGLLYLKKSKDVLIRGGGQESGIRPGTQNLFGIMALTSCLKEATLNLIDERDKLNNLMDYLIVGVRKFGVKTIPESRKLSDNTFVPNILSLSATPLPGEVLARVLDSKGFMISTGSACSSNKKSSTKGILSMGITEAEGFSSFRVSIGRDTTLSDVEMFVKELEESIKELAP